MAAVGVLLGSCTGHEHRIGVEGLLLVPWLCGATVSPLGTAVACRLEVPRATSHQARSARLSRPLLVTRVLLDGVVRARLKRARAIVADHLSSVAQAGHQTSLVVARGRSGRRTDEPSWLSTARALARCSTHGPPTPPVHRREPQRAAHGELEGAAVGHLSSCGGSC